VNGLAIRAGGIAWPATPALGRPLEARVYTWRGHPSPQDARDLIARYAPGLAPDPNVTLASLDVSAWQTEDGRFRAELYPLGHVPLLDPPAPQAIGDMFYHREQLSAVLLQLSVPASQAARPVRPRAGLGGRGPVHRPARIPGAPPRRHRVRRPRLEHVVPQVLGLVAGTDRQLAGVVDGRGLAVPDPVQGAQDRAVLLLVLAPLLGEQVVG